MPENNFVTDTQKNSKQNFSRRFKSLLMLAIILTGFISIPGLISLIFYANWAELGDTSSMWVMLSILCEFCIFITLTRIYKNKIIFFKILYQGMWIISIIFLAASLLFPRLPNYQIPRLEILVILDGDLFLVGILAAILASLTKEGIKMQSELDEIL